MLPIPTDVLLILLGSALILVGLAGVMLPALPGTPLIAIGGTLVAWAGDFTRVGWLPLLAIWVLGLASVVVDHVAGVLGARRAGASWWGMAGAVLGLLLGLPFGIIGIVLGPAIGATALEYAKDPDMRRAAHAGLGVFVGFVVGTALKYAFAVAMIGVLVLAWIW
jgi:hypothetical protein